MLQWKCQKLFATYLDAADGLPFSPFECSRDNSAIDWKATAMAVSEIFAYVCGLGDIQRDALYTCVRDAYHAYGFGSGDESQAEEYPTLSDVLRRIDLAERQRRSQNLLARCRPLLEMDLFRPPAGKRNDLMDSVRHGLAIDLHNVPSETLQLAAGAFLLRKLYRDMFQWGTTDRLQLAIVLDEAHRLSRDVTLPKIMKEGRKFGVTVVVASHGIADFHADVLSNAGTKLAFRANYPESRKIAGFFRGRAGQDLVALLQGLSVGQALI
ncbi:MAG: ATP-binding protein, partial [Candidatus Dormibacteraceae bacterium]